MDPAGGGIHFGRDWMNENENSFDIWLTASKILPKVCCLYKKALHLFLFLTKGASKNLLKGFKSNKYYYN
jgi:hypothetical protein